VATTVDPRLPRLRVELCGACRDRVAYLSGWFRLRRNGRGRRWQRDGEIVELTQ